MSIRGCKMKLFSVLIVFAAVSSFAFSDSLDRGHSILLEKGLQIQGLCSPQLWAGPEVDWPPVPPVQEPNWPNFIKSNLTGLSLLGNCYPELYFDDMPGVQWSRWSDLQRTLRPEELPYLPTLVGFSYDDEVDIADPNILEDAEKWFRDALANYPDVIIFASLLWQIIQMLSYSLVSMASLTQMPS